MKLLFMINELGYSGAPKMMAWVANAMAKRGHEVTVISAFSADISQPLNKSVVHICLNEKMGKNSFGRAIRDVPRIVRKYHKYVHKIKPDIIVDFMDYLSQGYIIANKILWHDIIVSSERADPFSRTGAKSKKYFHCLDLSSKIIFQTEMARGFRNGKYRKKSSVIPNPVVLNDDMKKAIELRKEGEINEKKIAYVGRLSLEQKRQDILLKAAKELLKRHTLCDIYIYGDGADKNEIIKMTEEMRLNDCVHIMGRRDKIPLEIFDSACVVLTSDYEGIPNSLIEAMSIGIPCVSTDCSPGGARMLIDDGSNGFLVDRGDYLGVAERVECIMHDKKLSERIGDNARLIAEKFSEEKIAAQWEKELSELLLCR